MPETFAHLRWGPQEGDVQVQGSDLRLRLPSLPFRSQPGFAWGPGLNPGLLRRLVLGP